MTCTFTNTKALPPPTTTVLPLPPEIGRIVGSTPIWPLLLLVGGLGAMAVMFRRRRHPAVVGATTVVRQAHPVDPPDQRS